ncbi:MAG: pyridoxal-phosphate dependent enzyme [Pseudomonadota bacterium]
MRALTNPYRGTGLTWPGSEAIPSPSTDGARPTALLARCPIAAETPLCDLPKLAAELGIAQIQVKDERDRMSLGSFKALGAAYVIAVDAEDGRARGHTYVTASAGNHGLSVAAGAAAFGANAQIFIADTVPESFADRLRSLGAAVVRAGATYEDSMHAAAQTADDNGSVLLSDSSWPGYTDRPHRLMEGYLAMMVEVFAQIPKAPTHILLQAGVGGLAGAAAAAARSEWADGPRIIVVEPDAAPALAGSISAGAPAAATGPVSAMGRLDCKEPSLIALKGLARDADFFVTITEAEGHEGAALAARHGLATTPSGSAGLSALAGPGAHDALDLAADSRALIILSEGPEDMAGTS